MKNSLKRKENRLFVTTIKDNILSAALGNNVSLGINYHTSKYIYIYMLN
jgi:hypothetical protein